MWLSTFFTNFGLDLLLVREVSQQRKRAGRYLYNSSFFRLLLSLAGAPLLAGVLLLWSGSSAQAIGGEGLLAIGLLYIGLFPREPVQRHDLALLRQ